MKRAHLLLLRLWTQKEQRKKQRNTSAETTRLTLSLEQDKDVTHTDGALHVTDDRALVLEELHADLGHSTTAASAAKHLGDLTKLGFGVLSRRHYREEEQTNKNTTQKSATRKKEREKEEKKSNSNDIIK